VRSVNWPETRHEKRARNKLGLDRVAWLVNATGRPNPVTVTGAVGVQYEIELKRNHKSLVNLVGKTVGILWSMCAVKALSYTEKSREYFVTT